MKLKFAKAAAIVGASLLALQVPASAAQLGGFASGLPSTVQSLDTALVTKVQYHHSRRGGHYRGGYHRGGGDGGAVAAGAIMGLAIGAMIAGQAAQHNRAVGWCMRRYRSYNPNTGTWVDYHGRVHYCP